MHAFVLLCISQHTTFEVPRFTDSKNMIGPKNLKAGHVPLTTPIRGYFIIPRLTLDIFYLHIKFGDSRFSRSSDMIAGVEIENGSCDHNIAPLRGGISHER